MKKTRTTATLLALMILLGLTAMLPATTSASQPITVIVNGKKSNWKKMGRGKI